MPDTTSFRRNFIQDPLKGAYIMVKLDPTDFFYPMANSNGQVREHRLVMAKHLKRRLHPSEIVHHIDGDPTNNSIGNLRLTINTHHSALHQPRYKGMKYLTQGELKALFRVINSRRDFAMFLLAYRHGLRASEVGMLRVDDLLFDKWQIRIRRVQNSQGGEYMMQPDEVKALRAWLKEPRNDGPWLFPSQRRLPVSRYMLDVLMKKYGEQAGIPPDKRHFHVLKHSIATHLLDAGADVKFVQDWIGHKNIQNTVVYVQISNRDREEQTRKLFASPMIVSG